MADFSIWSFSVTAIIAGVAAWFSGRQAVMAEERMAFDKFERRYDKRWAAYVATVEILSKKVGEISDKDIETYGRRALEAKFLFDEEMYRYLLDIRFKVDTYRTEKQKADQASDPEVKEAHERQWRESLKWITDQGTEEFPERFRKWLDQPVPVRPWYYGYDTAKSAALRIMRRVATRTIPILTRR
jgi:hypothetical protein